MSDTFLSAFCGSSHPSSQQPCKAGIVMSILQIIRTKMKSLAELESILTFVRHINSIMHRHSGFVCVWLKHSLYISRHIIISFAVVLLCMPNLSERHYTHQLHQTETWGLHLTLYLTSTPHPSNPSPSPV